MLHLPELLPDELMTGYVGRIARSNEVSTRAVWSDLQRSTGGHNSSPFERPWSHAIADSLGISADQFVREHTTLPLIRALRREGASLSHAAIEDSNVLRLSEMALPDVGPRLCHRCIQEDIAFWGHSYWRRSHQVRGISWCTKHDEDLHLATRNDAPSFYPEELLASATRLKTSGDTALLSRYADVTAGILDLHQALPEAHVLFRIYAHYRSLSPLHRGHNCGEFGSFVQQALEDSCLQAAFPALLRRAAYTPEGAATSFDKHWTRAGSGYAFALILTALYESPDQALFEATKPLNDAEQKIAARAFPTNGPGMAELLSRRSAASYRLTRAQSPAAS